MLGEGAEEVELHRGDRNLGAVGLEQLAAVEIEPAFAHLHLAAHRRRLGASPLARAAEHRLDPGEELAGVVGLGDIIVGADLESDDLVDVVAVGGEHDDAGIARARSRAPG
jgi:hypothetical protein